MFLTSPRVVHPTFLKIVLFRVTVWAQQFQVLQIVIPMIPVLVVHVQDFFFGIPAPFTYRPSRSNQSQFESALVFYFISRSPNLVVNASSMFVCTGSTACFCIATSENRGSTHNARSFFPDGDSIARLATIDRPILHLNWASIYRLRTNYTRCIRVSFM